MSFGGYSSSPSLEAQEFPAVLLSLHERARTTPVIRQEITASNDPVSVLAQRYNVTIATICKWRSRDSSQDLSQTAYTLQSTLTAAQETTISYLRRTVLLPLDDLLTVTREFLNEGVSRSGLSRCLRRHGVGDLAGLKPKAPAFLQKSFRSCMPGFAHMDISICRKWLTRPHEATCLWRLTEQCGGCLCRSRRTRARRTPAAFWMPCTKSARSGHQAAHRQRRSVHRSSVCLA